MKNIRTTALPRRLLYVAGMALAMLFILLPTASAQSAGAPGQARISNEVADHVRSAAAGDLVSLIVETRGAPSDAHLARMNGLGGALKARFTAINGYAARVPAASVDTLADDPDVEHVSFDTPVHSHMDVAYPAVGVTKSGNGVIAMTLMGPGYYPSAAYASIDKTGAGAIQIAAAGLGPQDGFTNYAAFVGDPPRERWGDYGAAVADGKNVWIASEYIGQTCTLAQYLTGAIGSCGGTRSSLANWGTRISQITP
jgi:hypothetical protein